MSLIMTSKLVGKIALPLARRPEVKITQCASAGIIFRRRREDLSCAVVATEAEAIERKPKKSLFGRHLLKVDI